MGTNCEQFRDRLLDERLDADDLRRDPHLAGCATCGAWVERTLRNVEHLRALSPLAAPARLDALVAIEHLERLAVPAELDAMVVEDLERLVPAEVRAEREALAREPRVARFLRTLERYQAPSVLERLVDEELADPAKARARRFAGELERLSAPAALWYRLERRLRLVPAGRDAHDGRTGRRERPLRLLKTVGGLAAAALLVVLPFTLFFGGSDPQRGQRSFQVHKVSSLSELSPMARSMADGLSGGALSARSGS